MSQQPFLLLVSSRERSEIGGAAKIGNLSCRHWSFFILFLKRQTRIYDASIVLAVIPAMVATNAPARVQRVFLTLTVIK